MTIRPLCRALICALALASPGPAGAVLRNEPLAANDPVHQELRALKQRIEAGEIAAALARLEALVADSVHGGAADVWSLYGFALRHAGRRGESRGAYDRALGLDPAHRGAHEYLGELLLGEGDLAGAERLLAALDALCPQGCEERADLAEAIAAFRAGRAPRD